MLRRRMRMRIRRRGRGPFFAVLGLLFLVLWLPWAITSVISLTAESQAVHAVEQFYQYEQAGDFGSSWELFHQQMKDRFAKQDYIQQRNHIFMQHFGVTSFELTLGHAEKIPSWNMSPQTASLNRVYRVNVRQTFKGTFGEFTIEQPVIAAQDKGKWRVLWDYNY